MPAGIRPQAVSDGGKVRRILHRLGEEPVFGRNLVERLGHQRLGHKAEPRRNVALGQDRIEAVEPPDIRKPEQAALRRIRVDVVEAGEACRVFRRSDELAFSRYIDQCIRVDCRHR